MKSGRKRDSVFERIIEEVAEEKGMDKRVVRHVVMGYYKQVVNAMEEGDMDDFDTFTGINIPYMGAFRPKSKRSLEFAKEKARNMRQRMAILKSQNENK